jgi:prophage maintenance system killer protein
MLILLSVDQIIDLNKKILTNNLVPGTFCVRDKRLLSQVVEEAEEKAQSAITHEARLEIIAEQCYNIANIQAFSDGNRRTALKVTQWCLEVNGYKHLSVSEKNNEKMIPRYLNHLVESEIRTFRGCDKKDFVDLLQRRFKNRNRPKYFALRRARAFIRLRFYRLN